MQITPARGPRSITDIVLGTALRDSSRKCWALILCPNKPAQCRQCPPQHCRLAHVVPKTTQ
eukprot:6704676-Lingulodinium_polyedra.AAC.1